MKVFYFFLETIGEKILEGAEKIKYRGNKAMVRKNRKTYQRNFCEL